MIKKVFPLVAVVAVLLFTPVRVWAIAANETEGCFLRPEGWSGQEVLSLGCLSQIVVSLITLLLSFLGFVTLLVLLFGAIKFVVSRGDPKAIEGAQKTMTYAVIGAVMVLGSFIIINILSGILGYPNILTQFSLFFANEKVARLAP